MATRKRSRTKATKDTDQKGYESTKAIYIKPFKNADDEEIVEREVHVFESEPAFVRVAAGQTCNLGDYESLRIDVAVTMPCYVEMVDETFAEVSDWVADRLGEEVDNYLEDNK